MPTTEEMLDGHVEYAIRLFETECWACDSGVRTKQVATEVDCDNCDEQGQASYGTCAICSGTKKRTIYENVTGVCDECGGKAVLTPNPWDALVQGQVFAACISAMMQSRESAQISKMNDVLDWAYRFLMSNITEAGKTVSAKDWEDIAERFKRAGQIEPKPRVTVSGNPLTPQELADLGITQDT